jgi:rhodanese-related sulfurtransferase
LSLSLNPKLRLSVLGVPELHLLNFQAGRAKPLDEIENLSPLDARKLIDAGECYVVDVRTPEEFEMHRIAGAHLLPVQELQQRHPEIPRESPKKILIYCEHGVRSAGTCQVLAQNGWKNLINMTGGMAEWLEEDLPVARGTEPDAISLRPKAAP